jgi:NTP pyrophosphatase (non-canonical NTP hydrolase)
MPSDLPEPFREWRRKAEANVAKWGWQSKHTLLLAATEELGELTQAFLEARHEGGGRMRMQAELDDLGALLVQLHWHLSGVPADVEVSDGV